MKIVIQRSKHSVVYVDNNVVGEIPHGMVVLVCFEKGDTEESIDQAIYKIINLRMYEDTDQKMKFNILQTKGEILSVSQFTLAWDGTGGHRPGFENAMPPNEAKMMYAIFNKKLKTHVPVQCGVFGAMMSLVIENDGPVTFYFSF